MAQNTLTVHEIRLKSDGMHIEVSFLNWFGQVKFFDVVRRRHYIPKLRLHGPRADGGRDERLLLHRAVVRETS